MGHTHRAAALCALLWACGGTETPDGSDTGAIDSSTSDATPTRRLSNRELGNTLETLTGVRPATLSRLPPDTHTFLFDRVAEGQTMSRPTLDATFEIGAELADTLVQANRLGELSPACSDVVMPALHASTVQQVAGASMSLSPEWAVTTPDDPTWGATIYAPDPTADVAIELPAPGRYGLRLLLSANAGPVTQVQVFVDGVLQATEGPISGVGEVPFDVEVVEAGSVQLRFELGTTPVDHNLQVSFRGLEIEGPVDPDPSARAARLACADGLITDLGPRFWRRPLSEADTAHLRNLYVLGADTGADGFRTLFQGLVTHPRFLYLVETGTPVGNGWHALDDFELAARLSYALCEQPPDAELWAAAEQGALVDADLAAVGAEVLDRCGTDAVIHFYNQWFGLQSLPDLDKSPAAFPAFTPEAQAGLVAEQTEWFTRQVFEQDATVADLYLSPDRWPDPRSASLANTPRIGILEQPAFLAVTGTFDSTSPVHRGVFLLEHALCTSPPPPPDSDDIAPPPPDPSLSTRERWAAHASEPACAACHAELDPIGFLFEEYDGIGQHRTMDGVHPVDASGGIPALGIDDGLWGVAELAQVLGPSPEAAHCFAEHWTQFATGQRPRAQHTAEHDALAEQALTTPMRQVLLNALAQPTFRHRIEGVSE